jgi:hypothetical protein
MEELFDGWRFPGELWALGWKINGKLTKFCKKNRQGL